MNGSAASDGSSDSLLTDQDHVVVAVAPAGTSAPAPADGPGPDTDTPPPWPTTLAQLPPLPAPDLRAQRRESFLGCALVLGVVAACLAGAHGAHHALHGGALLTALLVAVWVEAGVALYCLRGLMYGDPGVVRRTQARCFPLPEYVKQEFAQGGARIGEPLRENFGAGRNLEDASLGTYCVRCMLWRDGRPGPDDPCTRGCAERGLPGCEPGFKRAHHCRVCQRCVLDFDHHCGVFGRCIAGRGFKGNMGYFKVIIATGFVGVPTAGAAVVYAIVELTGWHGIGWAVLTLCCMSLSTNLLWACCRCRRFLLNRKRMQEWAKQQEGQPQGLIAAVPLGVGIGAPPEGHPGGAMVSSTHPLLPQPLSPELLAGPEAPPAATQLSTGPESSPKVD